MRRGLCWNLRCEVLTDCWQSRLLQQQTSNGEVAWPCCASVHAHAAYNQLRRVCLGRFIVLQKEEAFAVVGIGRYIVVHDSVVE